MHPHQPLPRTIGLPSAILLGLGSMVGTGVFVSLGLGAGLVGPGVVGAVVLAGLLAMCNGLSSAQLAAAFPVSGGTYEYGHRVGWPALGTIAGFTFLVAKSASAATAALAVSRYLLTALTPEVSGPVVVGVAVVAVALLTGVVLAGLRRTNRVNAVMVGVTFLGLGVFVLGCAADVRLDELSGHWIGRSHAVDGRIVPDELWRDLPHAVALVFVAYTGYGRLATLGEEVRDPRHTIPKAIIYTTLACAVVYAGVAAVAVGVVGPTRFESLSLEGAPLKHIAEWGGLSAPAVWLITASAATAMVGVVLNLVLGLSRVALAMSRRGHLPACFANVNPTTGNPGRAVVLVGLLVAALTAVGSIQAAWSLSAVTVLIYYAITNAAALRLPPASRLYPRVFAWLGLAGCLGLSGFVEARYWLVGGAVVAVAWAWHAAITTRSPQT